MACLNSYRSSEELISSTLLLLSDFLDVEEDDRFGSAEDTTPSGLAFVALQSEGDFLGGFGLLSEDGLGLTSVSRLLPVVTPPSLGGLALLTLLVLGDLVDGVSLALHAVSLLGLGDHNHFMINNIRLFNYFLI